MRDRYLVILVLGLILALATPTASHLYQSSLAAAERAGYQQGLTSVRSQTMLETNQAPPEVERFARAFCENDIEGATPFVPPQYLSGVQQGFAQGLAQGEKCVSVRYLGEMEKDGATLHIYVINQGTETNWWIFSFSREGLVVNIE